MGKIDWLQIQGSAKDKMSGVLVSHLRWVWLMQKSWNAVIGDCTGVSSFEEQPAEAVRKSKNRQIHNPTACTEKREILSLDFPAKS